MANSSFKFSWLKVLPLTLLAVLYLMGSSSCVTQKKYKEKSAALTRLDSLYYLSRENVKTLKSEIRALQEDTAACNSEVRELLSRFENLSESNSKEISKLRTENTTLKRQITGYKMTISRFTLDWRDMKKNMLQKDSVLATFAFSLDTLMRRQSLTFGINRELGEVRLRLYKDELYAGRNPRADAIKAVEAIARLMDRYPELHPVYYLPSMNDLKYLALFQDHLQKNGETLDIRINKSMNADEIIISFHVPLTEMWGIKR